MLRPLFLPSKGRHIVLPPGLRKEKGHKLVDSLLCCWGRSRSEKTDQGDDHQETYHWALLSAPTAGRTGSALPPSAVLLSSRDINTRRNCLLPQCPPLSHRVRGEYLQCESTHAQMLWRLSCFVPRFPEKFCYGKILLWKPLSWNFLSIWFNCV